MTTTATPATMPAEFQEFLDDLHRRHEGHATRSETEAFLQLWSHSPDASVMEAVGGHHVGYDHVAHLLTWVSERVTFDTFKPHVLIAQVRGDLAFSVALADYTDSAREPQAVTLRATGVPPRGRCLAARPPARRGAGPGGGARGRLRRSESRAARRTEASTTTRQATEGTATLTIGRTVHPGREREFETEFAEVLASAAAMPGWVGGSVFAVGAAPAEYDTRMHFASQDALDEWVRSDTRRAWLERLEVLSDQATVARLGAQDGWLLPPHIVPVRPPPRYRVALLTWPGICPLITAILALAGSHIAHLPVFVRSLVLTACVIPLMTWLVMPLLTRVTSTRLHGQHADPPSRDCQAG